MNMTPVYTVKIKKLVGWKSYKVIRHRLAAKAADGGRMDPRLELTLKNGENLSIDITGKHFRICSDFEKVKAYWEQVKALEQARLLRLQTNLLPGAQDASRRPPTYPDQNSPSLQSVAKLRLEPAGQNNPGPTVYGQNVRRTPEPTS